MLELHKRELPVRNILSGLRGSVRYLHNFGDEVPHVYRWAPYHGCEHVCVRFWVLQVCCCWRLHSLHLAVRNLRGLRHKLPQLRQRELPCWLFVSRLHLAVRNLPELRHKLPHLRRPVPNYRHQHVCVRLRILQVRRRRRVHSVYSTLFHVHFRDELLKLRGWQLLVGYFVSRLHFTMHHLQYSSHKLFKLH